MLPLCSLACKLLNVLVMKQKLIYIWNLTLLQYYYYYYCSRLRLIASITGKPAASILCLEHGGSRFCQSLANSLWDYWVLYPKRPYPKSSPQCKPHISYCYTTLVKYFQILVMAVLSFVYWLWRSKGIILYLSMKTGFNTKNLICNLFTGCDFEGQR